MLARIRDNGPVVVCDGCQTEIRDQTGVVLWLINGPQRATVMVIHQRCESSGLVKMLLPRGHRQQPLSQYLETILEVISV